MLLGEPSDGRHRIAELRFPREERHQEVTMAQWNQAFQRDVDEVAILDAERIDPLGAQGAEHRSDLHRVTGDPGEERRVRLHQDDVRGPRLHHLGVRSLPELRSLDMTQVDEPEAVALGLESLAELQEAHADRSVVNVDRLGGEHQDFEMTRGTMGAGNAGGDLEAALTPATDQDLALDQEGDGLLDGGQADLMLVGQVSSRRQKTSPSLLTDLGLDSVGKELKDGLFLEFRVRHGDL